VLAWQIMSIRGFGLVSLLLALALACEQDPELARVGGHPLPELDAGDEGPICPIIDPSISIPALPCAIETILVAKCQRCHSDPPQNTAPFKLTTWQDTQRRHAGTPIHRLMRNAVEKDLMPFTFLKLTPPVEPLTPDEKTTLLDWLEECGPPVEKTTCP
jgi:hypothetical protein